MNEWIDEWIAAWSLSMSSLYLGRQVINWLTSNQPMYDRDKMRMVREHNMSRDELFLSLTPFKISTLLFMLRGVFKTHYWMTDEQNSDIFWKKDCHTNFKRIKQIRTLDKGNTAGCLQQIGWQYLDIVHSKVSQRVGHGWDTCHAGRHVDKEDFSTVITKRITKSLSCYQVISRYVGTSDTTFVNMGIPVITTIRKLHKHPVRKQF